MDPMKLILLGLAVLVGYWFYQRSQPFPEGEKLTEAQLNANAKQLDQALQAAKPLIDQARNDLSAKTGIPSASIKLGSFGLSGQEKIESFQLRYRQSGYLYIYGYQVDNTGNAILVQTYKPLIPT